MTETTTIIVTTTAAATAVTNTTTTTLATTATAVKSVRTSLNCAQCFTMYFCTVKFRGILTIYVSASPHNG